MVKLKIAPASSPGQPGLTPKGQHQQPHRPNHLLLESVGTCRVRVRGEWGGGGCHSLLRLPARWSTRVMRGRVEGGDQTTTTPTRSQLVHLIQVPGILSRNWSRKHQIYTEIVISVLSWYTCILNILFCLVAVLNMLVTVASFSKCFYVKLFLRCFKTTSQAKQ